MSALALSALRVWHYLLGCASAREQSSAKCTTRVALFLGCASLEMELVIHIFQMRLAKIKTPRKSKKEPYFLEIGMKRRLYDNCDRQSGRSNKQYTIACMLNKGGPKYVEVTMVQLEFPYYNCKFRAPHGLVNHKYMYERAGDTLYRAKATDAFLLRRAEAL